MAVKRRLASVEARPRDSSPSVSERAKAAPESPKALSFAMLLLAEADETRAALREEVVGVLGGREPTTEDFKNMPLLDAVLKETMRLFPPAPVITRSATEADEVCGVPVYPGTTVLIAPWVLHRHEKLWDDPSAFRPERFLPGARETIDRFAYMPFGGGGRICIGTNSRRSSRPLAASTVTKYISPRSPRYSCAHLSKAKTCASRSRGPSA